jgi:glycosyltransferase involved in cell wall biosynthesis
MARLRPTTYNRAMDPQHEARLLSFREPAPATEPFFTIGVPHYKRRRYLEENLAHLFGQESRDFELVISDDCSPDDSNETIPPILAASGIPFRYYAQSSNLGYDGNVRFCLRNAKGRYVLMLGNDDALASPDVLMRLKVMLTELSFPEVCVTNFKDWHTGAITRRVYGTSILGSGPAAATHYFRSFSFTSGLIFDRVCAARHETDRWDRSIYYQIYLGCRILASGGRLAGIDMVAVLDHIRLEGALVPETYRVRYKDAPFTMRHKHTGLDSVARVTVDAIKPFVGAAQASALVRRVYSQLLTITYPYWLFEYRQLANWGWSFGIARDLWPGNRLAEYDLRLRDRAYLWTLYWAVTVVGLTLPASVFNAVRGRLAGWVRRRRQRVVN